MLRKSKHGKIRKQARNKNKTLLLDIETQRYTDEQVESARKRIRDIFDSMPKEHKDSFNFDNCFLTEMFQSNPFGGILPTEQNKQVLHTIHQIKKISNNE